MSHTVGSASPSTAAANRAIAAYDLDWSDPASMDDDDLLAFMNGQLNAGRDRRLDWELRAEKQLAWVAGNQDLDFDSTLSDFHRINLLERDQLPLVYQHPVQINQLRNIVLQKIALLLGGPVTLIALPATNEDRDVASAMVQTKLLQYLWRSGPNPLKRRIVWALWNMFVTGITWVHPVWDAFSGKKKTFKPGTRSLEQFREDLAALSQRPIEAIKLKEDGSLELPEGMADWQFRTGFDITEPESATGIDDCDWLIDTRLRSLEYVRDRYGIDAEDHSLTPIRGDDEYLTRYRYQMAAYREARREDPRRAAPEMLQLHSLWRPIRPWSEKGALIVAAGGRDAQMIVYKGANPYAHGEIPLTPMSEFPTDEFRPTSTVGDCMTLQYERNRNKSMIAAALHKKTVPKMLVEDGANVPDGFMREDMMVIPCAPGTNAANKVAPLAHPPIPAEAFREDEAYRRDIMEVSGVHEGTLGRGESRSQSGRHAAVVLQGDTRAIFVTRQMVETAISKAGGYSLWNFWQFCREKRLIAITGEDYSVEVVEFKGSDLTSNDKAPEEWNVQVSLSQDRPVETIIETIEFMTKLGYWHPQRDRAMVSRMLAVPTPMERNLEDHHRNNAKNENTAMLAGETGIKPAVGDDDDVHIEEHDYATTTPDYRKAVKARPQIDREFRIHRLAHLINKNLKAADEQIAAQQAGIGAAPAAAAGGPAGGAIGLGGSGPQGAELGMPQPSIG